MDTIKTLTTPAGHELVNVPAQLPVLLELGFTQEEAQGFLQDARAAAQRRERDTRLAQLAAYRQALLDVPEQAGFPDDIAWPVMPGGEAAA